MRHSALLGALLNAALTSVGGFAAQALMPHDIGFHIREDRVPPPQSGGTRAAKMQTHTGAGGRGAHRRWKHLRASGRA